MKREGQSHLGPAAVAAATLLLLALALSVSAAAPASAAAACEPGTPGFRPPQGCQGLGGNPRRPVPQLATDTSAGRTPRFHANDACREVAGWAPRHRQERDGGWITFYWVWVEEDRDRPHPQFLVCGLVLTVKGFSRGPGANGVSLRCPVIEQLGRTRADAVGWWVNDRRGFSHVSGGFGGNEGFGFWNYRLYNPHADAARVRLYGACRNPPFGHP